MDYNFTQISFLLAVITVVVLLLVLLVVNLMLTARNRSLRYSVELEQVKSKLREDIASVRAEVAEATLGDVSRDLHDEVGQLMTFAILQLETISSRPPEEQQQMLYEVKKSVRDSLDAIRSISRGLSPDFVNHQGLIKSLEQLLERAQSRTGVKVSMTVAPDFHLQNPSFAIIIFRIVRECLTNSLKHGKATSINLCLSSSHRDTEISISDNGHAATNNQGQVSLGWKNMEYYASIMKGTLSINSHTDHGTEILLIIPNYNKENIL